MLVSELTSWSRTFGMVVLFNPRFSWRVLEHLPCKTHLKATMSTKRSTLSISHTSGARQRLPNNSCWSTTLRLLADLGRRRGSVQ